MSKCSCRPTNRRRNVRVENHVNGSVKCGRESSLSLSVSLRVWLGRRAVDSGCPHNRYWWAETPCLSQPQAVRFTLAYELWFDPHPACKQGKLQPSSEKMPPCDPPCSPGRCVTNSIPCLHSCFLFLRRCHLPYHFHPLDSKVSRVLD